MSASKLQAQKIRWGIIEKEATFTYGVAKQENGNIPNSIMTRNMGFTNEFAPITTEGESTFTPSYSRMYALNFGMRLFFNENWFIRTNIGFQEQFFGYDRLFTHEVGVVEVSAWAKYFGVPISFGGGYSIPFSYNTQAGDVGAVNFYVGGFVNSLMSPRGQSEVTVTTAMELESGLQYDDYVFFNGIQDGRMRSYTSIFGWLAAISIEYNEITFSVEYLKFSGHSIFNGAPENDAVMNSGERTDWFGHALQFGVAFRFY